MNKDNKTVNTVVKTTTAKVKNSQDKLTLFKIYIDLHNVAAKVNRDIATLSGMEYKNSEGEVVLDSPKQITYWEAMHKIEDSNKFKENLQSAYEKFTSASMIRGHVPFICRDAITQNDEYACYMPLRDCGLLPLRYTGTEYDVLNSSNGYHYATIGAIHDRQSSWIECNKTTNEDYTKLRTQITEVENRIIQKFSNEELSDFKSFLDECKRLESDPAPCFFNFNGKFVSFYNNNLREALVNGNPISEGKWTTKSGKEVSYSCDKRVVDILYKYKSLWNSAKSILNDANISGMSSEKNTSPAWEDSDTIPTNTITELYSLLERKKEYASFKDINLIDSPIKLKLGNNYVGYAIAHDPDTYTLTFEVGKPKSLTNPDDKKKLKLSCSYKRVGHGTKCYLNDLVVEEQMTVITDKNKVAKHNGNYVFKYKINGKRERTSILREPSIRLVIKNKKMDINNPKLSDFDLYIDLCFNTEVQANHGISEKELFNIRKELSTSFPEIKDLGKQKNIVVEKESVINTVNKPIRVMGIDLGIKNPYAYSIIEFDKSGNHKQITSGLIKFDKNAEISKSYRDLNGVCFSLKKILSATKYYVTEGNKNLLDPRIKGMFNYVNEYFTKNFPVDSSNTISHEEYVKWIDEHMQRVVDPNGNVELSKFKSKTYNWKFREWTYKLRKIIIKLNKQRSTYSEYCSHFDWIYALESYRKLMNSFNKVGTESKFNKNRKVVNFKKIYDQVNNLKLDYIKKLASSIAETAHANGVCIVVTEKLDSMRGNVMNDKDKNSMFNMWPVGQIKDSIDKAISVYGILNADAEERNTSQVRCETGEWGYRGEREEIDILYFSDKDYVNADVNAAKNICLRYMNQHTDFHALSFYKQSDKYYVPVASIDERKRERGFLSKQFGSSKLVFELNEENRLVKSKKSIKDIKKKNELKNSKGQKETWYSLDNTFNVWISKDERKAKIETIENIVKKSKIA